MTKKSAASNFPKLSDYLTSEDNQNLNIRATVKAVREAFQSGELNIVQTAEAFRVDADKGLVPAKAGERAIIYNFLILDEAEFEDWLEENRMKLTKQSPDGAPAKLTAEQLVKLMESDPESFKQYQDSQRKSMKVYNGNTGKVKSAIFQDVRSAMDAGDDALALSELQKIQTRGTTSPAAQEKARLLKEIKERLAEQA